MGGRGRGLIPHAQQCISNWPGWVFTDVLWSNCFSCGRFSTLLFGLLALDHKLNLLKAKHVDNVDITKLSLPAQVALSNSQTKSQVPLRHLVSNKRFVSVLFLLCSFYVLYFLTGFSSMEATATVLYFYTLNISFTINLAKK